MSSYFVSFNPEIPMEENLPAFTTADAPEVRKLLGEAVGVLLPAYITPWRYKDVTRWARRWFPRLEARFNHYGKAKQIELFRSLGARHPDSLLFQSPNDLMAYFSRNGPPWSYPLVMKGDTGGGGSSVFPLRRAEDAARHFGKLPPDQPAILQKWVEHGGKDLRVVVYGRYAVSYFRVGDGQFYNNICRGGRLDRETWPELQQKGERAVLAFCRRAGIDVAGFDLMFPDDGESLFVEINFHFGRKGLGGSRGHRRYMARAVQDWRCRCMAGEA